MTRSIEAPWLRAKLEAVRARTDIAAVIGAVVKLGDGQTRRGKCPFHSSNRSTFYVSPSPAHGYPFAHCFGCGWHGDVIRFVADFNRIPFDEALEQLEAAIEVGR